MNLRQQVQRLQLPNTLAALAALLLLPAAALVLWPRPQAVGLGRVLAQAQLIQSFAAGSRRPVPGLWRQRLGAAAPQLWAQQQGVWWQFWGTHGDAGAYLVLPAVSFRGFKTGTLPQQPLLVDDLAVVAADPLSRQWLADRLRSVPRPQRGLEQRCLLRLRNPQVVAWTPGGLGALAGPVAPLLQRLQQGCLSLDLHASALDLNGEAAAATGVIADVGQQRLELSSRPLAPGLLLELRGPSLDILLQGLLARQLVREPLASRYGITEPQLRLLRRVPFALRLRALPAGPFQAGLELELRPRQRDRAAWARLLAGLTEPLLQQGLNPPAARLQALTPRLGSSTLPDATWSGDDGQVLGGWFWQAPTSNGVEPTLVLFLGPQPPVVSAERAGSPNGDQGREMRLRARPAELAALNLWPQAFPNLVKGASHLEIVASDGDQAPISQLTGRLELIRSR